FVRCIVGVARNSLLFVVLPPYSEAKIQKFQVEEFSNKEFFCRARQQAKNVWISLSSPYGSG
ncbi:MAG: hypothetical protein RR580_07620, partial [Christensenellaceae bacterium]